uniref:NADH-cytochrome b5 reductase n=1 Tax=Rhodnius prolixus TaxID=13249 RepID=R4G3M8_RHOPR
MKSIRDSCRLLSVIKFQRIPEHLIKRMSLCELNKPEEPSQEDCCQNGCNPCVFDIYQNQLKLWEENRGHTNSRAAAVQDSNDTVGVLPFKAGQYVALRFENASKEPAFETRDYTIVTDKDEQVNGSFQVLIKLYNPSRTSEYIKTLQEGSITYWRGPLGDFEYKPNKYRHVLMICMGTGIAPMYAIIKEILNNESDESVIKMMFGCRNPSEIIFREQLCRLSAHWNFNYICYLSEDYSPKDKKYSETFVHGKISEEHIQSCLKLSLENLQVLICGTKKFNNEVLSYLITNGVPKANIYMF